MFLAICGGMFYSMRYAVICFIETRCVVRKVKPPKENGLTLSH